MEWKKKISPDHTDVAYRQAVSRLRSIFPRVQHSASTSGSPENLSDASKAFGSPPTKKDRISSGLRSIFSKDPGADASTLASSPLQRSYTLNNKNYIPSYLQKQPQGQLASRLPYEDEQMTGEEDLFGFIEKQGAYITQLEKETKYCREELGTMLDKVRDVISENEILHERQKGNLLSSMIQQLDEKTATYGSGHGKVQSDVISNSRIAELEAQLSQAKRSLRLAQEEVLEIRRGGGQPQSGGKTSTSHSMIVDAPANCDLHQSQIESLSREKEDLVETLSKFKHMVNELKDRESEAAKRVKNSLEIVEQMQMEKAQSDMETRRLKEELDRHQQRVRDMIQEHSRKLNEEKLQVEKKYKQEIDHLNNEMNQEMDSLTKARLELERQKRIEADLRREIQQKMCMIDDLRQEMQIKISHFQAELSHCLMLKSTAEQELISARLQAEKVERDAKQDCARLQAESNGLRKRLEQADADLAKSQEVIVKLNENVSQLHRESSVAKMSLEGRTDLQESEVSSIIRTIEEKHARDMADLEQLIQVQNSLLDKLRNECTLVTEKLEETSRQNKEDLMNGLQSCIVSFQQNPLFASNPELQKVLLEDLSLILAEIKDWMQKLDSLNLNKVDPVVADDDAVQTAESAEVTSGDIEEIAPKEPDPPKEEGGWGLWNDDEKVDESKEKTEDVEKTVENDGDLDKDEINKTDNVQIQTLSEKLIEMNSQLIDWSKRMQDIIERCANSATR